MTTNAETNADTNIVMEMTSRYTPNKRKRKKNKNKKEIEKRATNTIAQQQGNNEIQY